MAEGFIKTKIDGTAVEIGDELIAKYDRPLPRYTSYPPAPAWGEFSAETEAHALCSAASAPVSLYIHIPFCDAKCAFCGCHSVATPDREIAERYVAACVAEMAIVSTHAGKKMGVGQIHFGGGTPTSIGIESLGRIIESARNNFSIDAEAEIGIEIDPRTVSVKDIETLASFGFNRASFGVQDFDADVGRAIGRSADPGHAGELTRAARASGMGGINFDLIYGLPAQNPESWRRTLARTMEFSPDRIALFNFAYLPSLLPHQKGLDENLLPSPRTKVELFAAAIEIFQDAGFEFIGLDHFARAGDALAKAHHSGNLTRNFQGYSAGAETSLVGLGATAISEIDDIYGQNEVKLVSYLDKIESGNLATARGMVLSKDDEMRRWAIRKIMCSQRLSKPEFAQKWGKNFDAAFPEAAARLKAIEDDGIVRNTPDAVEVTPLGRIFVRAVAATFDATLDQRSKHYSRGI
ncbi:MAG: oxygen-independent coproporphyrinogen III oxidase [Pseudomonadota bacterium]